MVCLEIEVDVAEKVSIQVSPLELILLVVNLFHFSMVL